MKEVQKDMTKSRPDSERKTLAPSSDHSLFVIFIGPISWWGI